MIAFKKTPFLWSFLGFGLFRILVLVVHYFRNDPFGMPIVNRIDRFLPFAIVVELGAIALLTLPFLLLSLKKEKVFPWLVGTQCLYAILGLIDLEVYRYLKHHLSLSFVLNNFRWATIADDTTLLSVQSDLLGIFLSLFFAACAFAILLFTFWKRPTNVRSTFFKTEFLLIFLIGLVAGSSQHWLNPSNNRYNRLLPPLYVVAKESYYSLFPYYAKPDFNLIEESLSAFVVRDTSRWVFDPQYPLIKTPLETFCKEHADLSRCQLDRDKDGFPAHQDCDDFNPLVFPGALDLPSDGLDQDCSGYDEKPVNIILLVAESFHQRIFNQEFANENRLPHFKRLANLGGSFFPNTFSNSFPSVYGAASIYLGIWNHPHKNIFGDYAEKKFKAFPEYFPSPLYEKYIITGADPYFDNQAAWLNKYYDQVFYDKNNGIGKYNADEIVFDQTIKLIEKRNKEKSFFITINNHSTHVPFKTPSDYKEEWKVESNEERFQKSLDYFDHNLGRLLDIIEQEEILDQTVFVLIGDHGIAIDPQDFDPPEFFGYEKNKTVAGIFAKNSTLFNRSISRLEINPKFISQIDIAPTLISFLGQRKTNHFLGQNLRDTTLVSKPTLFNKIHTFVVHSPQYSYYSNILDSNNTFTRLDSSQIPSSLFHAVYNNSLLMDHLIEEDLIWKE